MLKNPKYLLTDAQLRVEIAKCEYCEEKPCKEACPADCSPADFIMAVQKMEPSDFKRSTSLIMGSNPLGGVCGAVCPDYHCMKACVHRTFDHPVNIPAVQVTIVQRAKELMRLPEFILPNPNEKKIAVIGAGPAGISSAVVLTQKGYRITIFEQESKAGGMCNLIPSGRLDRKILATDIEFAKKLGVIKFKFNTQISNPEELLNDYDAVVVATGLGVSLSLQIPGENFAIDWKTYLENPLKVKINKKKVAVIGGGAIAVDCAVTAVKNGADAVEMLCLERLNEMPLTAAEREMIIENGIEVTGRVRVIKIKNEKVGRQLELVKVKLPKGEKFHPSLMIEDRTSTPTKRQFDVIITAIGGKAGIQKVKKSGLFFAGDMVNGPTTVVQAVASGKNTAMKVDAYLEKTKKPNVKKETKSYFILPGIVKTPIQLETDFFGRRIQSPFLLSSAPPTDGYEQMKTAYRAGWSGGVMKTAFDNLPIHIPAGYMFVFGTKTYGNCDNVSGHNLDRICREIEKLVKEFPDRLTIASTGGSVTGNDDADKSVWQSNTRKLENAGVMGIEYSLSCPQGGDGTKGDIVSQDAELTAKIISWILEKGNPDIPKLFKLTAAVTAIQPIVYAINEVFKKFPASKAGITLANTFPTLAFRKLGNSKWEDGVIVGMSGEGVLPISNLTLAKVSLMGITVSGNGGPMDYKAAANFLALGVQTVQFCTIIMKYGYQIIDELHSGLSYLMQERGINSIKELIGAALPHPITGFEELSSVKWISDVIPNLCQHCGNCTRCPYQAITLDTRLVLKIDPAKCIGCSLCAQKCFSGALYMRERTEEELTVLNES